MRSIDSLIRAIKEFGCTIGTELSGIKRALELVRHRERIRKIEEYKDRTNNYRRLHGCPARRKSR